ncbi:MAG: Lar family restriction alleviation protein [Lachnospiraceae bacterium]|nr:Lar family restriction alleviation protein [Lachnospiraceae bacterium]
MTKRREMSEFVGIVRPCPFCGSEDLTFGYVTYPDVPDRIRNATQVRCQNCRAFGPEYRYPPEYLRKNPVDDGGAEAVRLWNDRVSDAPRLF